MTNLTRQDTPDEIIYSHPQVGIVCVIRHFTTPFSGIWEVTPDTAADLPAVKFESFKAAHMYAQAIAAELIAIVTGDFS